MSETATIETSAPGLNRRALFFQDGMAIAWAITAAAFLFHLYFNNRYGYFRDEFNYISCGDNLQWGYVDQPPLVPFLVRLSRAILGDSLRAIRFMPALASSLLIVQTALFTRELGGKRYAMLLTAIAVALAPQYSSNGGLLGTNCLEPTFWLATAWFALQAIKRAKPTYWLWSGAMLGLGLLNKYSILLLGIGIIVGLLLTPQRTQLRTKWLWFGVLVAFLIFLPNLIWNIRNHWPMVELLRNIRAENRDVVLGPLAFFFSQLMETNFFAGIVWLIGLGALLFSDRVKPFRFLGWSYLFCYAAMYEQHGKAYYLAPIYPMLLAVGAFALENWFAEAEIRTPSWGWARHTLAWTIACSGLWTLPITVPMLSPEGFIYYADHFLPFKLPVNEHSHARFALPQWYGDQFGWKEIADEVEVAWNRIPPDERPGCAIFGQDYGQAGAVEFFGRPHGLPRVLSGDRTYFLWGPRGYSGDCMIVMDDSREKLETLFDHVEYVGTSAPNPWAFEQQIPVFIGKGKKFESLEKVWPKLKHWH